MAERTPNAQETGNWLPQNYLVGHPLERLGRYAESLSIYDELIMRDPANVLAHLLRGRALLNLEHEEDAHTSFLDALKLAEQQISEHPEGTRAYIYRADALFMLEREEEALIAYDQAIQLTPHDYEVFLNKGWAQYVLAHYLEAITLLQHALELHPNDPEILFQLNKSYWDTRQYDKALEVLERAISLEPSQSRFYAARATTLSYMGRGAEAKEAEIRYQQLLQSEENDANGESAR